MVECGAIQFHGALPPFFSLTWKWREKHTHTHKIVPLIVLHTLKTRTKYSRVRFLCWWMGFLFCFSKHSDGVCGFVWLFYFVRFDDQSQIKQGHGSPQNILLLCFFKRWISDENPSGTTFKTARIFQTFPPPLFFFFQDGGVSPDLFRHFENSGVKCGDLLPRAVSLDTYFSLDVFIQYYYSLKKKFKWNEIAKNPFSFLFPHSKKGIVWGYPCLFTLFVRWWSFTLVDGVWPVDPVVRTTGVPEKKKICFIR